VPTPIKLVFFDGGHGKDKGAWPNEFVTSPATITPEVPGRPGRGLHAWRVTTQAGKTAFRQINGFSEPIATAGKLYVVWDFKIVEAPSAPTVALFFEASSQMPIGYLYVNPNRTVEWKLLNDDSVLQTVATSTAMALDQWYTIETYYQRSTGDDADDGGGHLKIDRTMIGSRYDIDIYTERDGLGKLKLGCPVVAQDNYVADYANAYLWLTPPQHEVIGDPAVTGQPHSGPFRVANHVGQIS